MSKPVALIVTGDRHANELRWRNAVQAVLGGIAYGASPPLTLIHGDCAGIDRICRDVAQDVGRWTILPMPYIAALGRAGGPARNREMATVGRSLLRVGYEVGCYAFHDRYEQSKGTRNMVETAKTFGLPVVRLCTSDGTVREA